MGGKTPVPDTDTAAMLATIDALVAETALESGIDRLPPHIRDAVESVPRSRFVPEAERHRATLDTPLPIGCSQTISQPFIVALMTALLDPQPGETVLEIGTGSGYQAAILAHLGARVLSMERHEPLAEAARKALAGAGIEGVEVRIGDGWDGAPDAAPFDRILVTAAAARRPERLLEQLAAPGRAVIPIDAPPGESWLLADGQWLTVIDRDAGGCDHDHRIMPVRFVPMVEGG